MANDLAPAVINNGGTGSSSASSSAGIDYRQLQAPEAVRTDLPDNGAAARAEELHHAFQEFEGISQNVYNKEATRAGALAGAASGNTGHPQYKQGLARLTAYGKAFNNAATGAYAVQAETQADDAATAQRIKANNNPDTFYATYTATRDAVLKEAPPDAVPMLTELYNKRLALGMAAIRGDMLTQQRDNDRKIYDDGIAKQTSRVAQLQGSKNMADHLLAEDEQVKLNLQIEGGFNSGLYSRSEADAMHYNSMRQITAEVYQTQIDDALKDPNGNPFELMERFRIAHEANLANPNEKPILSEPEYQKLQADATTKIREWNMARAYDRRDGRTEEELRYQAGDDLYTEMLLRHQLTEKALADAVASHNLKAERATALRSLMLADSGGRPTKSTPSAYARISGDPNFLDMKIEDIAAPDLSSADAIALYKEQQHRLATWENTQAVKDGQRDIDVALKIPPGTPSASLSDDQKKARVQANQEYLATLKATDPAKRDSMAKAVAQQAIDKINQRNAAEEVQQLKHFRDEAIKAHGPGSPDEWDAEKMKQYLKQKDDAIAAATARAQGK